MTSRRYTRSATRDATKRYASDLNNGEFALIAPQTNRALSEPDDKRLESNLNLFLVPTKTPQ